MREIFKLTFTTLFVCGLAFGLISTRLDAASADDVPLPGLAIRSAPVLAPLPDSDVYVIVGFDTDVAFYQGRWWRRHHDRWYSAMDYDGSWTMVNRIGIPMAVFGLQPGFHKGWLKTERIPYGRLKKNWKSWEKEKHWHKTKKKMERKEHKREMKDGRGKDGSGERGHGSGKGRR